MRRLGATVAVAMLMGLAFAGPAEAGRPAPAPEPYISQIVGTVDWVQDSQEPFAWYYMLHVSVTAVGLGTRPLYIACTKIAFDAAALSVLDQPMFQPATRPRGTDSSTVTMSAQIPAGSRTVSLTSQLMKLGNRPGCCTAVGSVRTVADASLPHPPLAHGATSTIFDRSFTVP